MGFQPIGYSRAKRNQKLKISEEILFTVSNMNLSVKNGLFFTGPVKNDENEFHFRWLEFKMNKIGLSFCEYEIKITT